MIAVIFSYAARLGDRRVRSCCSEMHPSCSARMKSHCAPTMPRLPGTNARSAMRRAIGVEATRRQFMIRRRTPASGCCSNLIPTPRSTGRGRTPVGAREPDTADGLPALEAQLTGAAISGWIAGAQPGPEANDVVLPKFAIASDFSLPDTLVKLGIVTAFDPDLADLSGIDGARDLFVDKAVHKAMITVDEDGAEAAAATGIGVGDASAPEPFRADHPFVFAIYDAVTGSILFMGRVTDPTM